MKRFVSILALFLVAVLLVSSLAGCQKSREKMLIGRWREMRYPSSFIEFAENGTGYYDSGEESGGFFWETDGDNLFLEFKEGSSNRVRTIKIEKLTERELHMDLFGNGTVEFIKN